MSYLVTRILSPAAAAEMANALADATFADGRYSATGAAAGVKHNLQAQSGTEGLDQQLLHALEQHDYFATFALPLKIARPTFARYEPGMAYGAHVDTALAYGLRSDLAMTLFLSPPESYDGGELVIEETFGGQEIKLEAGEAIVYPATTLHRVAPVTRGVRLVAVTWIQSRVRDSRVREIIYDLSRAMALAHPTLPPEAHLLFNKCRQNLLRIAADA